MERRSTLREPITTSAPSFIAMSSNFVTSSIGADESASANRTYTPEAASTPWRILYPLPRFPLLWIRRTLGVPDLLTTSHGFIGATIVHHDHFEEQRGLTNEVIDFLRDSPMRAASLRQE